MVWKQVDPAEGSGDHVSDQMYRESVNIYDICCIWEAYECVAMTTAPSWVDSSLI